MRQKATAARPPANAPALAVVSSAPSGPATVQSLGQQLRELLPPRRLHSVSVCDHEGNVLWLSEGALGPDENFVVMEALGVLSADTSLACHDIGLEDGRHGLFLPVRAPTGALVGLTMILADNRSVGDDTQERVTAAPMRALLQRLAVLMKPDEKRAAAAPIPVTEPDSLASLLELVPDGSPPPQAAPRAPVRSPAAQNSPAALTDHEVSDILEFDLGTAETPRVPLRPAPPSAQPAAEMLDLEFLSEPQQASQIPVNVPVVQAAKITPVDPVPVAPPARALPERRSAATAAQKLAAAAAAAAPSAAPVPAPPTPAPAAASPAARVAEAPVVTVSAPASDAQLVLEVLPYAKLRAGGQTRRFQVQARIAAGQRDPAALDALVLQRLLGWLAAHRSAWNSQPTGFTVSLSIAALEDERFVQKIAAALNQHGISAETLGFELTEAVCTQRRAQVERFMNQCEKLGAWVVIDDFSFDSQVLPLLKSKALRLLKINSRLSSSAMKDKLSQALVVATVQAAKVMGVHCGAKKVDSQAAAQWLTAIGCDFAQGAALAAVQPLEALAGPVAAAPAKV